MTGDITTAQNAATETARVPDGLPVLLNEERHHWFGPKREKNGPETQICNGRTAGFVV